MQTQTTLIDMKEKTGLLKITMLLTLVVMMLAGCRKKDDLWVSTQDLYFGLNASTQILVVRANSHWTITKNGQADWYTISPMSGNVKDSVVMVSVDDNLGGESRDASFTISSSREKISLTVVVSQNKLEPYSMVNKIFGVTQRERWITDFNNLIIEDEYKRYDYDPYDTTTGYLLFFQEDSIGVQRDHHTDTVAWWPFKYWLVPDSLVLHMIYETPLGPEVYAPNVLVASDTLFRFIHEYKPHYFEHVDMRKVGTILPDDKSLNRQMMSRRKERGPLFLDE